MTNLKPVRIKSLALDGMTAFSALQQQKKTNGKKKARQRAKKALLSLTLPSHTQQLRLSLARAVEPLQPLFGRRA